MLPNSTRNTNTQTSSSEKKKNNQFPADFFEDM